MVHVGIGNIGYGNVFKIYNTVVKYNLDSVRIYHAPFEYRDGDGISVNYVRLY